MKQEFIQVSEKEYSFCLNLGKNVIDISYIGKGDIKTSLDIILKDSQGRKIYQNTVRKTKHMGIYGIEVSDVRDSSDRYTLVFSSEVDLQSVYIRDGRDFFDIRENFSEQTLKNEIYVNEYVSKKELNIVWFVTWICNYSCPFCWERAEEDKYRGMVSKLNEREAYEWADSFNDISPSEIYITGGEPTIYKRLPEVISLLKPGIGIKMTTNFGPTFDLDAYSPFILSGRFRHLGVSFHPSEISFEEFKKKIKKACELGYKECCEFVVEMVLYPDDIHIAEELLNFCAKEKILVKLDYYNDPAGKWKPSDMEAQLIQKLQKKSEDVNKIILSECNIKKQTGNNIEVGNVWCVSQDIQDFDRVVLVGAGYEGYRLCGELLRNNYEHISCFADNKCASKQKKHGIDVISVDDACKKYTSNDFVITVANTNAKVQLMMQLIKLGIDISKIHFYKNKEINRRPFVRGYQPIFCPAGRMQFHVDPDGNAWPCMVALNNAKIFGVGTMPTYHAMGNILFDKSKIIEKNVQICWESFRCSACDYGYLEDGMVNMELKKDTVWLPLPQ